MNELQNRKKNTVSILLILKPSAHSNVLFVSVNLIKTMTHRAVWFGWLPKNIRESVLDSRFSHIHRSGCFSKQKHKI